MSPFAQADGHDVPRLSEDAFRRSQSAWVRAFARSDTVISSRIGRGGIDDSPPSRAMTVNGSPSITPYAGWHDALAW